MNRFFSKLTGPLLKTIFRLKAQTSSSAKILMDMRLPSGAWGGRLGTEDLYYTRFAVRALELCGNTKNLQPVAEWIVDIKPRDAIECFCLIDILRLLRENNIECPRNFSETSREIIVKLKELINDDTRSVPGKSIYHTFLARLAVDMCEDDSANILTDEKIYELLSSRQRSDGGFADSSSEELSQTNPTAAAAGLLGLCKNAPQKMIDDTCAYLISTQQSDGGFGVSADCESGDMLSTFTALAGLFMHKRLANIKLGDAGRFVKSCRQGGAFAAFPKDSETDAEYIYYGLGSLAILCAGVR